MNCPCNGCTERVVGCHSNCPKEPSYADWRQWLDERLAVDKVKQQNQSAYLRSLEWATKPKRRKR